MTDSNYKKLQEEGSGWSYNSRWGDQMEEAIVNWFHPGKDLDDTILDLGCGEGRGVKALLDLGHKDVYGLDITKEKVLAGNAKGLNLFEGDVHDDILGVKNYDYIFTSHALEHMHDLPRVMEYLIKATRKEIWFIIPCRETKEFVKAHNPSHVWPINDPAEFTSILDKLNVKYKAEEVNRMCAELHGVIDCSKQ